MNFLFSFILLGVLIYSIKAQDPCNKYNDQGCMNCTLMTGPNFNCGWCGPTQTCMNGTKVGPTATGERCYGDSWFYGTANPCPNCNTLSNCKSCLYWSQDCFWCDPAQQCREWGSSFGCQVSKTCPCDVYDTCSQCITDPGCFWCGTNSSCMNTGMTCQMPAHTCPCDDNNDCTSCLEDISQGCAWCETPGGGTCTGTPGDCLVAHNCNQYCGEQGTTCDSCVGLNGCAWCETSATCVDSSDTSCNFLSHACPDCGSHHYCDTCQDAGCVWCQNGECRRKGDTASCTVIQAGNCDSYCGYFGECASCNVIPGCNWCDDIATCVDSDISSCHVALGCGFPGCGFDGGAFVGGMFLGIGLVAIGIGGFLFYRWKTGSRAAYSELK